MDIYSRGFMKVAKCFIIFFSLINVPLLAQQPQFQFELRFEDAAGQKDTMTFIADENANVDYSDSVFGEIKVPFDSVNFRVYVGIEGDSVYKTVAKPYNSSGVYPYPYLKASNYELPIIVTWDTFSLVSNGLTYELRQAYLLNNNYLINEKVVDLFADTIVELPPYTIGGGPGNQFPLDIRFSFKEKEDNIGIYNLSNSSEFSIYPNPVNDNLNIRLGHGKSVYRIYSELGVEVQNGELVRGWNSIDLSSIGAGLYVIEVELQNKERVRQRIIKSK